MPLAALYNLITTIRNRLYDSGFLKSHQFKINTICVGNLRVGGTGKTPFVDYLITVFDKPEFKTSVLSRGYGRKTNGFLKADENSDSTQIGDEPLLYFRKHKGLKVYVDENRPHGIQNIIDSDPNTNLIILDDAFQHRPLKAKVNILLTEYSRPFYSDYLLPAGRLRESRYGAKRADLIVVTKSPPVLDKVQMESVTKALQKFAPFVPVFFSSIIYESPVCISGDENTVFTEFNLVSGIDNPEPFVQYCSQNFKITSSFIFNDHYDFKNHDIENICSNGRPVITTEKDITRLLLWKKYLTVPVYYLPIKIALLDKEEEFLKTLKNKLSV